MMAVDTNVLVYAHRREMPMHEAALSRLRDIVQSSVPWALPVFVIGEFVRLITHRRLFDNPHTPDEAKTSLYALLDAPSTVVLRPGPRYARRFADLVGACAIRGNLAFDAQIAALCLEAGVSTILSEDRDFDRFEGLRRQGLGS